MSSGRIAIVGAGIVGAAVFHRLAIESGDRVALLEKAVPGVGATGFSGGILRAFHLDPELAQRCADGLSRYAALAQRHGDAFRRRRTGFLHLVDVPNLADAQATYRRLAQRMELQWLAPLEATSRFKLASTSGVAAAVYEPGAGYIDPRQSAATWLLLAQQAGGQLRVGVDVQGLRHDKDGRLIGVHTNFGPVDCDTLVLCAGAWTPALLNRLELRAPVRLRTKTIQVNVIERPAGVELPAFVDAETEAYGRPDGHSGALVGCPVDQWDLDAEAMPCPDAGSLNAALARASRRFPWMATARRLGAFRRHDAYDTTGRGIVERCGERPQVVIATGFSGNGVKLAPEVAERVAALTRAWPSVGAVEVTS